MDNDGFITRDEMYNIVDAIYQMVVSEILPQIYISNILCGHCRMWRVSVCVCSAQCVTSDSNVTSKFCNQTNSFDNEISVCE